MNLIDNIDNKICFTLFQHVGQWIESITLSLSAR